MKSLYPLMFTPIYKRKIWGGDKLQKLLNKDIKGDDVGESWEISGVQGDISVVENGFLSGNSLEEIIEVYMDELVGDNVYKKFGLEFPLLIKFIDANDVLSVQVHPDDEMAKERHNSYGKTEMWYVMEADKDAELIIGFNRKISKDEYITLVDSGNLESALNKERVKKGDCFFMPAGRIHAIGAKVIVAEIQQTSDITYRIFDWNRTDAEGNRRELHTDLAVDAIDFTHHKQYRSNYDINKEKATELVKCPYFTTNILEVNGEEQVFNYSKLDSFVIYMCVEGEANIIANNDKENMVSITKGRTILIPATIEEVHIIPKQFVKLLEISIQ